MKKLLAVMFLAGTSMFGQISIGINIGPPPPQRILRNRPRAPGPDYFWVDGYWYPQRNRYVWHTGYYTRPPYPSAVWIGPRYEGRQFFDGYWSAGSQQMQHDHNWDRRNGRDYDRNQGNGNGNGKGNGNGRGNNR